MPPRGLSDRVLGRLQREHGRGVVEIAAAERGRTTVATAVVARLARHAARSVPDVVQVSVVVHRVAGDGGTAGAIPADAAGGAGDGVLHDGPGVSGDATPVAGLVLDLHLIATLGPSLPDLAAEVRAAVATHVDRLVGVRPVRVDVTIDDVV